MNKKGFLLLDSLINVLVVSSLCLLCFSVYKSVCYYKDGYESYLNESNEQYDLLFSNLKECEKCKIIKEDSQAQEPY